MDTSDPDITFNEQGECSYCQDFDNRSDSIWFPNEEGKKRLEVLVNKIKADGKGKEYDCIIGLSGGIDSSYLAYYASQLGLRILAVHVDAGWNSELAVQNIENIVKKCNLDLHTHVIDWEEMRDLQAAFFRSGVANQDVPQDHAFFAGLYTYAIKNNFDWVLHGGNIATEFVLPKAWGYNALDSRHVLSIHKKFGRKQLKTFPIVSFFKFHFYIPFIKKMKIARMLDYMPYDKDKAIDILTKELDFKYYGGKHHESRFTKFFQSYYLPVKFGYDKRKAHLSSMILSGTITRAEALDEMSKPSFNLDEIESDMDFVAKKLGFSSDEFKKILAEPNKSYKDYPNNQILIERKDRLIKLVKKILGR